MLSLLPARIVLPRGRSSNPGPVDVLALTPSTCRVALNLTAPTDHSCRRGPLWDRSPIGKCLLSFADALLADPKTLLAVLRLSSQHLEGAQQCLLRLPTLKPCVVMFFMYMSTVSLLCLMSAVQAIEPFQYQCADWTASVTPPATCPVGP